MGKQNRPRQKSNQNAISNVPTQTTTSSESPSVKITMTIIAAIATIIVAVIGYLAALKGTVLPIEATQTAESFHTFVAMTQTTEALETSIAMTQDRSALETSIAMTQIANALETETSTAMTQTADALVVTIAMTNQAVLTQNAPIPTEIKPVRYEYTVEIGDTLKEISKKYFILDVYADAIGKANCNQSPVAGDILVIRYFYVQPGDTVDLIAERFGGSPDFLRSINHLSQEVIFPPVGQIFILPGRCGG